METLTNGKAEMKAGKKFRLTVKSAEEAVRVIRDKLGDNARVLSVRQVGGEGLKKFISSPKSTAHGSLHKHITKNANVNTFQPMNINFGIIDSFNENIKVKGRERKALKTRKAIKDFKNWIKKQAN